MLPLEYMQIHVCYNPHMDTGTRTRVNVNALLGWVHSLESDQVKITQCYLSR